MPEDMAAVYLNTLFDKRDGLTEASFPSTWLMNSRNSDPEENRSKQSGQQVHIQPQATAFKIY